MIRRKRKKKKKGNLTSIARPRIQEHHRSLRNRVSLELHGCRRGPGHRQR